MPKRLYEILLAPILILAALILIGVGMALPYGARAVYVRGVAFAFHLPFIIFGKLATCLLRQLDINPAVLKE